MVFVTLIQTPVIWERDPSSDEPVGMSVQHFLDVVAPTGLHNPWAGVLGKQAELDMERKPVSNSPPWFLLWFLPLVYALASLSNDL